MVFRYAIHCFLAIVFMMLPVSGTGVLAKVNDPELIFIGAVLYTDGTVELEPWDVINGTPDLPKQGSYSLQLIDNDGSVLTTTPFGVNFTANVEPFGEIPTDFAGISLSIPYPQETALVKVVAPDGSTVFEIDPIIKVLRDAIDEIPDQCFVNDLNQKQTLLSNVSVLEQQLTSGDVTEAIQIMENDFRMDVEQEVLANCNDEDALATTKEALLALINNSVSRLETRPVN